jgi:hypothetical protein
MTSSQFLAAKDQKDPSQSIVDRSLKDAVYMVALIRSSEITIEEKSQIESFPPLPFLVPYDIEFLLYYLVKRKLITLNIQNEELALTIENDDVIDIKWKICLENFEPSTLLNFNYLLENLK